MHGDYRYDQLKNTAEELRDQETSLQAALVKEFRETPTIVCGYSARDDSVMRAFRFGCRDQKRRPTVLVCAKRGGDFGAGAQPHQISTEPRSPSLLSAHLWLR